MATASQRVLSYREQNNHKQGKRGVRDKIMHEGRDGNPTKKGGINRPTSGGKRS